MKEEEGGNGGGMSYLDAIREGCEAEVAVNEDALAGLSDVSERAEVMVRRGRFVQGKRS